MDGGLLAVAILFLTLSSTFFALRVYVRGILIQRWGLDDWLISCAMVAFIVYSGLQITGIIYGIGRHLNTLSADHARQALMFWWLCEIFYIPATIFLKLSVGVFLHRLAIQRWHLWVIRFMTLASGLFGTAYFFLAVFQCRPIDAWWIRKHAPPLSKDYGWCFDNTTVVVVTFVSCSLNAIADCTFGIMPIFIVKGLQMPRNQKKLVAAILSFANIACVATIVRTPFTIKFFRDDDFLFETRTFALLSTIEPGVGIAACCIATLRPLLHRMLGSAGSSWLSAPPAQRRADKTCATYSLARSPVKLPTDPSSNYAEISATWRPKSPPKAPTITGREMKALYATSDLDDGSSYACTSIPEDIGTMMNLRYVHEPSEKAYAETARTGETLGFTFFDDITEVDDESLRAMRKSWPVSISLPPSVPPLPVVPNDSTNDRQQQLPPRVVHTPTSPQSTYHRYHRSREDKPPGAVGDPFGAWRHDNLQ